MSLATLSRQCYQQFENTTRKGAERGDEFAQFLLGRMYAESRGVPKDEAEAAKWFHRAAEQGQENAQYHLGMMYLNGQGVPRSETEAVKWLRKATEQGLGPAKTALEDAERRIALRCIGGEVLESVRESVIPRGDNPYGYEEFNKKISNLRIKKSIEHGLLIVEFDTEPPGNPGLKYMIRLFDSNGQYLTHIITEPVIQLYSKLYGEAWETGWMSGHKDVQLLYRVNQRNLEFAGIAAFGVMLP